MSHSKRSGWKWLAVIAVLGGAGWFAWPYLQHKDEAPQYQTVAVTRMDITQAVTATGQLSALVSVQVGSQISGNIKKLFADFNTPVKAAQVVAQLDPATYEANVHQAEGELASAQAALELATLNADRKRALESQHAATKADLDKAIADLHQAEATVKIKTAALEKASVDLARCTITAPVNGVVVSRNVDVGQTVAAAMTAPVLFTIANDLKKMHIEASVSEADIGGVEPGLEAGFKVEAFPDRDFKGKVVEVRNSPVTVENVVSYVTVIEVSNDDLKLRPGMTANVTIVIDQRKGVLAVPNAALRFRLPSKDAAAGGPGGPGGGRSPGAPGGRRSSGWQSTRPNRNIYRLVSGALQQTEVTLGLRDEVYTEVKSGLDEGDKVVTGVIMPAGAAPAASPFGGGMPRRF